MAALLAQAGLDHWREVIDDLLARYAGLENLTVGIQEGARPEIVALLRRVARQGTTYNDVLFANAIARMVFLDYRVHRVVDARMTPETWEPDRCTLADFRGSGEITAYPYVCRAVPPGMTARQLLQQVRRHAPGGR